MTRWVTALGALPSLDSCTWPDPPALTTFQPQAVGPQSGAGLAAAGRRAGALGVGWGGRILRCPQPTLQGLGRPHPFPDCGLCLVRAQITSLSLCPSSLVASPMPSLRPCKDSPLPSLSLLLSTCSSQQTCQSRGAETREMNKVDSRQTPPSFPSSGLKKGEGGSGPRGLAAQAATFLFSSYSSTWKLILQKQLPSLLPQYKAQVSFFPIKGATSDKNK